MANEMRDRLVELIDNADVYDGYNCLLCERTSDKCNNCYANKLADHLIANGVIVLPCKVGDVCYPLEHSRNRPITERKVSRITFSQRNIIIGYYENDGQYRPPLRTRILGEDIFLTKEQAELKEMRGE